MFSIEADIESVSEALSQTGKSLKSISRQVVGTIARGSVKKIKSVINATTHRQTGELYRAYGYKVKKDGSRASVFPKSAAIAQNNHLVLAKIATLSYGNEITTKKSFLQVNGNGYYARPKTVKIAPRNFVQAGEKYIDDGTYQSELEKLIDKELAKYWSK